MEVIFQAIGQNQTKIYVKLAPNKCDAIISKNKDYKEYQAGIVAKQ